MLSVSFYYTHFYLFTPSNPARNEQPWIWTFSSSFLHCLPVPSASREGSIQTGRKERMEAYIRKSMGGCMQKVETRTLWKTKARLLGLERNAVWPSILRSSSSPSPSQFRSHQFTQTRLSIYQDNKGPAKASSSSSSASEDVLVNCEASAASLPSPFNSLLAKQFFCAVL